MNLFVASKSNLFGSGPSKGQCATQEQQQQHESERRLISAASSSGDGAVEFGSAKYYALCGLGGILSCGLTHTAVTPLDLVKCRIQVDKEKYKNLGHGFKDSST